MYAMQTLFVKKTSNMRFFFGEREKVCMCTREKNAYIETFVQRKIFFGFNHQAIREKMAGLISEAEVQLHRKMMDCAVEGANVEILPQKNNGEDSAMCSINGILIPENLVALAEYCLENKIKLSLFKIEMVATWDSRQLYDWTPPSTIKKMGKGKERLETLKFASLIFALLFVFYQLFMLLQPMIKWIF